MLEIDPGLAACRASVLPTVIYISDHSSYEVEVYGK